MVAQEPNGKYPNLRPFGPGETAPDHRPREVRALKRKVIDLKTVLVDAITPEELHTIARNVIELALAGNMDAATWIVDRCIGKPQKSIEITAADERSDEPPKVVEFDWRKKDDILALLNGNNGMESN